MFYSFKKIKDLNSSIKLNALSRNKNKYIQKHLLHKYFNNTARWKTYKWKFITLTKYTCNQWPALNNNIHELLLRSKIQEKQHAT